jgi:hypothetical protein
VGLQPGDQYHIIFATSFVTVISSDTTVPPALPAFGGLAAADYTVTFAAAQAGLVPGWNDLDITYKALLSTNGNDARDRITITGPVYNTNGFLIANSAADLWDGSIANPVMFDEYGDSISGELRDWTGTLVNGTATSSGNNWNQTGADAMVGRADAATSAWVTSFINPASGAFRLYGISPPITVVPEPATDTLLCLGLLAAGLFRRRSAWSRRL